MSIANRPDPQASDKDVTGGNAAAHSGSTQRPAWGPGLSLGLSGVFFLVVLSAGVLLDDNHRFRSTHPPATDTNTTPSTPDASTPLEPAQASDAASTQLARAHICAATGKWNCVIEATRSVIALRGATPETQALLEQAVSKGGWPAPQAEPRSSIHYGSHARVAQRGAAPTLRRKRLGACEPSRAGVAPLASTPCGLVHGRPAAGPAAGPGQAQSRAPQDDDPIASR